MAHEPAVNSASKREAWHTNWVEAISSLARAMPSGEVRKVGGLTLARSGLAIRAFNCAFALDPPQTLEGATERIEEVLVRPGTAWLLVTTTESCRALQPLIEALRLKSSGTMPGMAWEPLPSSVPPNPADLDIRHVEDADDARTFARTMMQGFEGPPGLLDPWAEAVAVTGLPAPVKRGWYIGYVGNRPACTAVRFTTGSIAGIYGVSTLPEFRRRGFGAAITYRAAVDGRQEGCEESYLQSSPTGRTVYEGMGYHFVEEYQMWTSAELSAAPQ
jgi:GNAT superfamily N-acetyltransferase